MEIIYKDLGRVNYKNAWNLQHKLFNENIEKKTKNKPTINKLLFCEHNNVYTIGKNGNKNNLLLNDIELAKKNIDFFKIDRGGDITYHGIGQLVVYPIFDLDTFNIRTKQYIHKIEKLVIKTMSEYKIKCRIIEDAPGIWIESENHTNHRKICAIGVRSSRGITMHGFALNINTDLSYFNYINACGFTERGVTSMQKELKKNIKFANVKSKILENFSEEFNLVIK